MDEELSLLNLWRLFRLLCEEDTTGRRYWLTLHADGHGTVSNTYPGPDGMHFKDLEGGMNLIAARLDQIIKEKETNG